MEKRKSFPVSFPLEGNLETFQHLGKQQGNSKETGSLKALANKVIQRNSKETLGKLEVSQGGNFKGQVSRQGNSETITVVDTMKAEYQRLITWLKSYDLTGAEIRETLPDIYLDIQTAINKMDEAMIREDLQTFRTELSKIKPLYTEALRARQ